MPKIELTKSQCKNLADFIEWHFFQSIREDTEIDCIEWARELLDAEKAFRKAVDEYENA